MKASKIFIRQKIREMKYNHFPELLKKRIFIIFVEGEDFYMAVQKFWIFGYLLFVDLSMFEAPRSAIIGCLAHELSHILDLGIRDERKIDQIVIDRGFGKHLYELIKHNNRFYRKYKKKHGLTKKEVRKQLKELNMIS